MRRCVTQELIERAARDLLASKYAIALTGAGISTESGIPDFRGPDGIWTRNPEAERKAYQTYQRFKDDPRGYWEERLAGSSVIGDLVKAVETVRPNPGHYALAELEKMGVCKWVITQNVDNLHQRAGSKNVLDYHGNAFKLRCIECGNRFDVKGYDLPKLKEESRLPPLCPVCKTAIKEDVVHFREPIPPDVARRSREEVWKCDVMLICGTSAAVYPFAELPRIARQRMVEKESKTGSGLYLVRHVPATTIIEVNVEPTLLTNENISDYLIQGKTGEILPRIVDEVKRAKKCKADA